MSLNNFCVFTGRLTRDVETRAFANGDKVSKFGLAVNTRLGKDKEKVFYAECSAFGKVGEIIEKYAKKGSRVMVNCEAELEQWETDGQKRSKVSFRVNDFQFMDAAKDADKTEETTPEPKKAPAKKAVAKTETKVDDDQIPF